MTSKPTLPCDIPPVGKQRQWLPLVLCPSLTSHDPAELLLLCSHWLTVRLAPEAKGGPSLEVFCLPGEEHSRALALAQTAAADLSLRQVIRNESDPDISKIVDSVLSRAVKG